MIIEFQFDRLAERLVYSSLKSALINQINFPSGRIYLQEPFHQYVNTRTETTLENEEIRYPSISIYSIKENEISSMNSYDVQYEYLPSGQVKAFESDMNISVQTELLLECTTTKDFHIWKNKLKTFIMNNRHGLPISNDILPNQAYFNMIFKDGKDFLEPDCKSFLVTVMLEYRIYREVIQYVFEKLELYMEVEENNEFDGIATGGILSTENFY